MADNTIGKAYVQIVPSADGITGSITNVLKGESISAGENSGASLGNALATKFKAIVKAAALSKFVKMSIEEGGKLQQSIGGVETLYESAADAIKKYARNAYQYGLSANEYMEQATSFAASLKNALKGDVVKAAETANMALQDMADNSAKLGTPIESLQTAYQGFAKQNYTMLDNLKLGYGGTKTEMERLLKDAAKLPAAMGKKFDLNNLADVYEAIHLVQDNLHIAGVAAEEARTTFSGSFQAMQAAARNLLGDLSLGEDIKPALQGLLATVNDFIFGPGGLIFMLGNIATGIVNFVTAMAPQMALQGMQMLRDFSTGFVQGIPDFLSNALTVLDGFANTITANAPIMIESGFEALGNLVQGITNAIPELLTRAPEIISKFADVINNNFPTILQKGFELIVQFVKGIISAVPTLVANIPKIVEAIVKVIQAFNWLNLGKGIIEFFGNGIKAMKNYAGASIGAIKDAVVSFIKDLPSKLFEIGSNAVKNLGKTFSWSAVSFYVEGLLTKIGSVLKELPSKVWEWVKSIPEKLKEAFRFEIPKIKLPHISVTGKLSLMPPSVPKIGIEWYAKGGLFNGATVVPGIGEAGPEYALPLNERSLRPLASMLTAMQRGSGAADRTEIGDINIVINGSNADPKELVDEIERRIAEKTRRKGAVFA